MRALLSDYVRDRFKPTQRVGQRVRLSALGTEVNRTAFVQLLNGEMLDVAHAHFAPNAFLLAGIEIAD